MGEKDMCPICLSEYTCAGEHRIVSLKCGHLFGDKCLKLWFGKKKSTQCPKCYRTCRRSDVRPIFTENVSVTDTSREEVLLEQVEAEREARMALERENERLCVMVKYLSNEVAKFEETSRCLQEKQDKQRSIHKRLRRRMHVKTQEVALLAYDQITSVLLWTSRESSVGVRKISTGEAGRADFLPVLDLDCDGVIRDIKVSPYNDGLVCLGCGGTLKVLSIHEDREIASFRAEGVLWSVSFDPEDRDTLFGGDDRGHVNVFRIGKGLVKRVFLGGCPIHSLHKIRRKLYCAGVFGLWKIDCEEWAVEKIDVLACFICTNLYGSRDSMVAVLRNRHMRTKHLVHGAREVLLHTNQVQVKRRRDKVYGNLLFTADDTQNRITVYDTKAMRVRHVYNVREKVLDFYNTAEGFYILSEGCFYVFVE